MFLGKPLRKGREDCHSSGRVNRRVQSHPPIPDQTARGSRGASSSAGSSRAYGNARLSCTRRDRPPPPFPLRLSQFWRTTACAFPKYSPPISPIQSASREGERRGRGTARQPHGTTAPHSASSVRPPPCPSPLGAAAFCSLPKHAHQPPPSRLHRRRRTAGEERETQPEKGAGFGLPVPGGSGIHR
jgi:hypothetical protein